MAAHQRSVRLHALRRDVAASRQFFDETLRLRAVAEDAKSVSYDAGDVVLVLDWTLDHAASLEDVAAVGDVVLLVDEIDAVEATLTACGVPFTPADHPGLRCTPRGGRRFVLLDLSDECLMWPGVGWRTGRSTGRTSA